GGAGPYGPHRDEARRHREGRRGGGDRARAAGPDPLHRHRREARRPATLRGCRIRRRALRVIRFSSVAKRYPGGLEALRDISAEIGDGEMVAVSGHSGAGKSTLLRLAAGIERASSGTVIVQGQNLASLGEAALA